MNGGMECVGVRFEIEIRFMVSMLSMVGLTMNGSHLLNGGALLMMKRKKDNARSQQQSFDVTML